MSLAAMLLALPFGMKQLIHAPLFYGHPPYPVWLELGYILVFATLIGYFLSVYALNYITPFY